MSSKTKENIYQIGGIVVGLVLVYFLFQFLYGIAAWLGWTFFIALLVGLLGYIYGNPFAPKPTKEVKPSEDVLVVTPLEVDSTVPTTRSLTDHEI